MATRQALNNFQRTGNPFSGSTKPEASGNGSLMRLCPVPLFYGVNRECEGIERSADSSRTTHGSAICLDACRYYAALIIGALQGESKERLLSKEYYLSVDKQLQEYLLNKEETKTSDEEKQQQQDVISQGAALIKTPEIKEVAEGSFKEKQPPDIKASGYVAKTLEAALWAFYHTDSFEAGALKAGIYLIHLSFCFFFLNENDINKINKWI